MADFQNPIPGLPPGLLALMAQVPSANAAGKNALTQGIQPGINSMTGALGNHIQAGQIAKLLQQLRGPQQAQAQQPAMPPQGGDPLGLFGPTQTSTSGMGGGMALG